LQPLIYCSSVFNSILQLIRFGQFAAATAALVAQTNAIKSTVQLDAKNQEIYLDYQDFTAVNIMTQASDWYSNILAPFYAYNRDDILRQASLNIEDKYGELFVTCGEGTTCRELNKTRTETEIKSLWKNLLESFHTDVYTTILKTEVLLKTGHGTAVECEEKYPCCNVEETIWTNIMIQIESIETQISLMKQQNRVTEARRHEIEMHCDEKYANGDFEAALFVYGRSANGMNYDGTVYIEM